MKIRILFAGALAAAAVIASPASAATVSCSDAVNLFTGAASTCSGFFGGNLLSNSPADVSAQTAALQSLGVNFTNFNDYTKVDLVDGATTLDFGTPLSGPTVIGIHFGNGSGFGNSTGFFTFDFVAPTQSISFNIPAASGAVLYSTGTATVPEPATWAMMLLGFAGIGTFMRRRRRTPRLLQIA
ncbi:MAG: PEPxxWA-CTERM sorting domain-containing protein [Sphingomonas sp.]